MKLFYETYGDGKPIVILHGLLGSLDNWHTISRRLGESYRVFAVDQTNHGRSPHSDEMTYDLMARDVLEFLDDHGLESAALIGHSMGGKAAMNFALQHADRTAALIVVDIAPKAYSPHHDHIFDALTSIDLSSHDSRSSVDQALAAEIASPITRQFLMKNLKRQEDQSFRWKVNLEVLRRSRTEVNREISSPHRFSGPVLFIRGEQSDYIEDTDVPMIKSLFPRAELRVLPTGHWVHAEAPDAFFSTVVDFLTRSHYHS